MRPDTSAASSAGNGHGQSPLELVYLSDRPPEPTRWLVDGIIPEQSCLVLGAEEKAGKTWVAFLLAICIVTGQPFFGRKTWRRGKVLIYSPESGWNARSQRMWGLCWNLGLDPTAVLRDVPFIAGRVNLADSANVQRLTATVAAVQPALLVFDPLIASYLDRDENSAGDVQGILNCIRDLTALSPGMSTLVAHHFSKAAKERSSWHSLRGSGTLGAWSDGLITVRKDGDEWDAIRRVDILHRDARSPEPFGFRIVERLGEAPGGGTAFELRLSEAPDLAGRSSRPKTTRRHEGLVAAVAAEPGKFNAKSLAAHLGSDPRQVQRDVSLLVKGGKLRRANRRLWPGG